MSTITCFIGLGSNQNHPLEQLQLAIKALKFLPQTKLVRHSAFYQSSALVSAQNNQAHAQDYLNAVAELTTSLAPFELLQALQKIENSQGRKRNPKNRWASRTLDLDILLYGDKVIHTQQLMVPHYAISERDFVLQPLVEIAPELIFPNGSRPIQLLQQCDSNNVKKLDNIATCP